MANFLDLPEEVRERIYALHLQHDEPVTIKQHRDITRRHYDAGQKSMPPLLQLSPEIEEEAMPFYYANNHFLFNNLSAIYPLTRGTWPRHLRLIRKVTFTWEADSSYAIDAFQELLRLKSLHELYIRVDEKAMLTRMLCRRKAHQRAGLYDPTPQQQMAIIRFPGIVGLLKFSGIRRVQFMKLVNDKGEEFGGPIPGGILESQVAAKMMAPKGGYPAHRSQEGSFPFLALSPELRNIVYDMLLRIPGQLSPSPKPPTSAAMKRGPDSIIPESALSLLAVNRQVHDEAVGIFYHHNALVFHYSLHLHGFLQSLGPRRQASIRDITVHYADVKSGGMSMVELTFALLKGLTGLRRLEVVMHGDLARKITGHYYFPHSIHSANPGMIPGMKVLFELRGVKDIKVRDLVLEQRLEDAKKDDAYPNFGSQTTKAHTVKLAQALEHFNSALSEAQSGRVNRELLQDNMWQMQDVFPTLKAVDDRRSPEL